MGRRGKVSCTGFAEIVRLEEITTESIREMADGIAGHLLRRRSRGGDLPGAYLPTRGRYAAESGTDLDRSLVAFVLLRYARTPGVDPAQGVDARLRAFELLERVGAEGEAFTDPISAAFAMAAVAEVRDSLGGIGGVASLSELVVRAASALDSAYDEETGFAEELSAAMYGPVAFGLASRAALSGDGDDLAIAEAAVRGVYAQTEPGKLVSQMPWLLLGEQRVGALSGDGVRAVAALRGMRTLIFEHQLTEGRDAPADLVGGIVFTTRVGVRPTWQSVRAISAAAAMLGDPALTEGDETLPEVGDLVRSLRFVRQLCADEVVGHLYVDPAHARWGVRESPWTQKMRPDASALGLLASCEALDSMSRIESRRAGDQR